MLSDMVNVIDFINTNRDRYVRELKDYLAIPSISALPAHQGDLRTCAEWTGAEMTRVGLENVRLIEAPRPRRTNDSVLRPLRRAAR
jgi:acetylornithine deacetylase/succinyl-diaminopimelate desuccinylase-like protein